MLTLIIIVMIFGFSFASGYLVRAEISHRRRMRVRQQQMWGGSPPYSAAVEEREAPLVVGGPLPRTGVVAECEYAVADAYADDLSNGHALASVPSPETAVSASVSGTPAVSGIA